MPPSPDIAEEQEHTAAVSGTPTAWLTLGLLVVLVMGWIFFDTISCGMLRAGLRVFCWWRGDELRIERLDTTGHGWIEARGVELLHGPHDHRSSWKSEWVRLRPSTFSTALFPEKNQPRRLIQELQVGSSKVLVNRKISTSAGVRGGTKDVAGDRSSANGGSWDFLPAACTIGPMDLVVIGGNYRIAFTGLNLRLPERWTGRISYNEADIDLGNWHRVFPKASSTAGLEGNTVRIGALDLGKQMELGGLTLAPRDGGIEFGIRGRAGAGQLRGDGTVGMGGDPRHLEITLVGERLNLESFNEVMPKEKGATGTISQARLTFRGDSTHPMDAESSLRLIARDVHWQGQGWESLRIAATMTGRNLTLSELTLQQQGNEVVAEGQSQLPADWRQVLQAPFTARFHADLEDVHTLASLVGAPFDQLAGAVYLEGEIKGSENKAEGYCNMSGSLLKIRDLPLDWVKGCLLFEGEKTRLSHLEASSGEDSVSVEGAVANSRPHAYAGSAEFNIRNLTKRLAQLGVQTAPVIGSGGVKGTWHGEGSMGSHRGSFQTEVSDWISRWTTTGMTGRFEGSYAPGKLDISKAEARQDDLKLSWKISSSVQKLEVSSIVAIREGKTKPLVEGSFSIPVNALDLWQSGDPVRTLGMSDALAVNLTLHGIKAEELALALGQKATFAGTLEGTVAASGTPARPEIHSSLQITRFEFPMGANTKDLSMTLESTNGRLALSLQQEPRASSPLYLQLEIPFGLTSDQGMLHLADTKSPLQGAARFRHVSADGWLSLLSGGKTPLHQAIIDGNGALSGTLQQPDLHGNVTISADEAHLFGAQPLTKIALPLILTNTSVAITNGWLSYGDKPVAVSGSLDWKGLELQGSLRMSGTNLSLPLAQGIRATGKADLELSAMGTNAPVLGGVIQLTSLESSLRGHLTPFFAPPGIRTQFVFPALPAADALPNLQVDLTIKTTGNMPVTATGSHAGVGAKPTRPMAADMSVNADLSLRGSAAAPRVNGTVEVEDARIELPPGSFVVPRAKLQLDGDHGVTIEAEAFGITTRGLCALGISDSVGEPRFKFQGPANVNAPEMMLLLSRTPASASSPEALLQSAAWLRQETMFPLPSTDWMISRLGNNQPSSLGFYGSPWTINWDLRQLQPSTH